MEGRYGLTSKEAVGDEHHINGAGETAGNEEHRRNEAASHRHSTTAELVRQCSNHWSYQSINQSTHLYSSVPRERIRGA